MGEAGAREAQAGGAGVAERLSTPQKAAQRLGPARGSTVRLTLTFSNAARIFVSVTPGWLTRWTRAWAFLLPLVVYGRPTTSHSPVESVMRSPI